MFISSIAFARTAIRTLIATVAIGVSLFAQQSGGLSVDFFQQALAKERAEGDLSAAIKLYERAVAEAGSDRTTAGTALLHMADCYAKLGSPEARTIYDRIITQFPDMPDLLARARAALTPIPKATTPSLPPGLVVKPAGPGAHLIDAPAGRPSPDARWVVVRSQTPEGPRLVLMDQTGKQVRDLVKSGPEGDLCGEPVWSRDSTRVVYPWCPRGQSAGSGLSEWHTGNITGATRVLVAKVPDRLQPLDWSADGQSLLAWTDISGSTGDLVMVDLTSGRVRLLGARGVPRPMTNAAALSPDGRFAVLTPDTSERGIVVVAVDSGVVRPLATPPNHDIFLGWHPDGRHLLLVSDRLGTFDVWSAAFSDGAVQGAPERLVTDVGPIKPLGLTAAGALYYSGALQTPEAVTDMLVASVDPSNLHVTSPAHLVTRPGTGHLIFPLWSADSRQLAYKVGASGASTTGAIAILTLATGGERQVTPRVTGTLGQFDWSSDGRQFVASYAQGDRQAIYVISSETGEAGLVASGAATSDPSGTPGRGNFSQPRWMPDGRSIAWVMDTRIVLRSLVTGQERTLVSVNSQITSFSVAPDGESLVFVASQGIMAASVTNGQPRRVAALAQNASAKLVTWSPDSRWLIYADRTAAARVPGTTTPYAELWRVPAAGGESERLHLAADSIIQPAISPDGRWIAFSVNADISPAVHVLELLRRK